MKLTNQFGFPQPIYSAVMNDDYDAGDSDISVTSLIDAPQPVELKRRHKDEIVEDVADRIDSLYGQAMHTILERSQQSGMAEERLYITVNGWKVSGQYDYIDEDGTLWDWKTVSVYEVIYGIKPSREQQLNIYAYMAKKNGIDVKALRIGFIFRDWRPGEAATQSNYPPYKSLMYPIRMWSEEEAEAFIAERVRIHQAARNAVELPECTPEERWQRKGKWAVMRTGAERASKITDTQEEAETWLRSKGWTDARVQYREGANVRCLDYCSVSSWCSQFQQYKR